MRYQPRYAIFCLVLTIITASALHADDNFSAPSQEAKLAEWRKNLDTQDDAKVRKMLHDKELQRHKEWISDRKNTDEVKKSKKILGVHPNKSKHLDHNKHRKIEARCKKTDTRSI